MKIEESKYNPGDIVWYIFKNHCFRCEILRVVSWNYIEGYEYEISSSPSSTDNSGEPTIGFHENNVPENELFSSVEEVIKNLFIE